MMWFCWGKVRICHQLVYHLQNYVSTMFGALMNILVKVGGVKITWLWSFG